MKRSILAVLLAASMLLTAFSLASCTSGTPEQTESGEEATSTSVDVTTDEAVTHEVTTAEATSAEVTTTGGTTDVLKTPEEKFRYDNYANGRLSDKLLDSVNPGVLSLLSCCMYYEDALQAGIKQGQKWVYSNSSTYVPQTGTFDNMLRSGKYGANCAMPQAWAFIDMNVVKDGKHIYGDSSGGFAKFSSLGKYIGAVCDITAWEGSCKFKDLYAKGLVEPGDIFLAKGHTFIYLGDNKFMAAGHDSHWHSDASAPTDDSNHAVFDSWIYDMKSCSDYNYVVYWQIRFKDDFVPRYYRNAEGKVVANPVYDVSKNIEYVAGKSPETPAVNYPVQTNKVYDTSGKVNVLEGIAASKDNGFNLSKINGGEIMTDGQLYYDNTSKTYSDCVILGGNSYALNPTYYCDANGNTSPEKDETHKYLCGIRFELKETATVDSFSLYTQAVGASTGAPFGDIDGFDILVSVDGVNWMVAYSAENVTSLDKWSYSTESFNKSSAGYSMCHYLRASFDKSYEAKFVLFALTSPRTQIAGKAQGTDYSVSTTSVHYFRIAELQVYKQ